MLLYTYFTNEQINKYRLKRNYIYFQISYLIKHRNKQGRTVHIEKRIKWIEREREGETRREREKRKSGWVKKVQRRDSEQERRTPLIKI